MKLFWKYLRTKWSVLAAFAAFLLIFFTVFALGRLPLTAYLYAAGLCVLLGALWLLYDFFRTKRAYEQIDMIRSMSALLPQQLPQAATVPEDAYRNLLTLLQQEAAQKQTESIAQLRDMTDYYTAWAHQIKTPIASMKLALSSEDSALSRVLSSDLLRIEQYVQMVLTYLRLDADTTDYVFRQQKLDDILRPVLRKYAPEFIGRKLSLDYAPTDETVLTDEKWLSFVIEQLLSNALKYTQTGSIRIYTEADDLCIADTGIGIAPEDLPRIFDKGYTGQNGRRDKTASGIGLYLCRRICKNLGIGITAQSEVGKGTTIRLTLQK